MRNPAPQRRLKLGAFFHPTGHHVAAWLAEGSQIDAGTNFEHYVRLAQTAERAKFDLVFLADAIATRDGNVEGLSRWPQYMAYFEPLTLLSALAAVTKNIGLVCTATTSYNEPYHIARKFASLDHISHGRVGWNVVTSSNASEAFNFGRDAHFGHSERYDRAAEFVNIVKALWDSYDDDAFVRDRSTGRYFEPSKLHYLRHRGKHFSVRGPLNVARPPQGYPVIFQASASDTGKELLSNALGGIDLSNIEIDKPLPDHIISPEDRKTNPRFSYLFKEKLTVREMYQKYGSARGQRTLVGTATEIADQMEQWFVGRAVDGYLIQPPQLPTGLDEFIDQVVPVLQERGLYRTEYEGSTLRENLGLKRPPSSYANKPRSFAEKV
jgi:alkanesulfonate monooxygenase SsuD/methylene tetrahydromethanopterin reductase-like flavin-dependent oxidoreductase (luciferase family)